ncbi:histone-like nucleoid-structuring protein Lsr2 [Streptomyces sp. NPDC056943]|uniref:Lsr2 family DNA-binding protein n=1 Tax=Streptomyces sp. NPDC056943 TaxID=3345971 RepID=UPI0036365C9E
MTSVDASPTSVRRRPASRRRTGPRPSSPSACHCRRTTSRSPTPTDQAPSATSFTSTTRTRPPDRHSAAAADTYDGGHERHPRAWARAHGYDVPDRGRMPVAVLDAWRKARNP